MKKLIYLAGLALLATTIASTVTSCGPSAEEVARQDSIRRADSIRTQDSIRIADSLQQVRKAEEEAAALRAKVDEEFAKINTDNMPVKVYSLNKIVYGNHVCGYDEDRSICIKDIATGDVKTIKFSNTADMGGIDDIKIDNKDDKSVKVWIDYGGSFVEYDIYTIDVEKGKITKKE